MLDETPPLNEPSDASGTQVSLLELFFVMTLVAVAMGVYVHISPLLAFLGACAFLVYAAIRLFDIGNLLLGGIVGYLVAMIVMWLFVATCNPNLPTSVVVLLYCPALGYIAGAFLAEVQQLPTQ